MGLFLYGVIMSTDALTGIIYLWERGDRTSALEPEESEEEQNKRKRSLIEGFKKLDKEDRGIIIRRLIEEKTLYNLFKNSNGFTEDENLIWWIEHHIQSIEEILTVFLYVNK